MSKAEFMGVSQSELSCQTGNCSSPKQTIPKQTCEFVAQCINSEPAESKNLLGSEAAQNEPQETGSAVTRSPNDEKLQAFCGDVQDNSLTEHLELPLEDVSKCSQIHNMSCSQQDTSGWKHERVAECGRIEQSEQHQQDIHIVDNEQDTSEQKHEIVAECGRIEQSEQHQRDIHIVDNEQDTSEQKHEIVAECGHIEQSEQHQRDIHIVDNELRNNILVTCSSVDNENLQPISEDVRKSSQTDGKQRLEFSCRNGFNELNADCVCSETSEPKPQLGSEIIHNEPADRDAMLPSNGVHESLQTISEDMIKICPTEPLQSPPEDANNSCQIGEKSCPQQSTSEMTLEVTAEIASHEPLEVNNKLDSQLLQNMQAEISTAVSCYTVTGQLGSLPEFTIKSSPIEHLKQHEVPITTPISEHLGPSSDDVAKSSSLEQWGTPHKCAVKNPRCLGNNGKRALKPLKKIYMLRSKVGTDRVLRSRSGEKPKASESINNLAGVIVNSVGRRKRKMRKNKRGKKTVADEYSKIRMHLRYLLNRINYEKSLIAAYSSEGWKGLSMEKLKPEKELQRATAEILRRKLKIRDLFQHLDSLCTEGAFPKSLFDSEGQIDSEDIFCSKCGSKDLTADNDIILCDGACDRGFHQYCLEPPLSKEEIPPDDEGWLCPGCDCKVDCLDLVNESQGTNLFITDNWEKVFPEAAAAGHNQDPNFGLPSDDSDDNDYDPDAPANDEKDQGDESSSDESDFTSSSDELEASADNKDYLGLPSDDSEDDDFNPDAPELEQKVMQDSSSSDFTSDSEDLDAVVKDNRSFGNKEGGASVSPLRDSNGQRSQLDRNKESLNNEVLFRLGSGQDGAESVYGKRSVERLDYKKLYDETYAKVPSSSSDDEDWTENDGTRKRMTCTGEGSSVAPNGNGPISRSGKNTMDSEKNLKDTEHTPERRVRGKLITGDTNVSFVSSSTPGSSKRRRSSYKRLGEDATQKLLKSFNENQYPDRMTKETLAKELVLTVSQVSKWFENTRWSFNHSSSMNTRMGKIASAKSTSTPQSNKKSVKRVSTSNVDLPKTSIDDKECSSGDIKYSELATQEYSKRKSTTQTPRKRKRKSKMGCQASNPDLGVDVMQNLPVDPPKVQETQTNGRTLRRRKSTI